MTRVPARVMILVFRGTHQVLAAEKRLKKGGVPIRLIPAPRTVTTDCGLAIRIGWEDWERAREILSASRLLPVSAHIPGAGGDYEEVDL